LALYLAGDVFIGEDITRLISTAVALVPGTLFVKEVKTLLSLHLEHI